MTALRHRAAIADPAAVDGALQAALAREGSAAFGYLFLIALAPSALRRTYRAADAPDRVLRRALELLLGAFESVTAYLEKRDGIERLSCAEFLFRCLIDAGLDVDVEEPLFAPAPPPPPPCFTPDLQ